eukprot:9190091-Pyramimonas_sp.AAC.2
MAGAGPGAHPPGPAGLPAGHVRGGQRRGGAARLPALRVLLPPSPRQSRQAPPGAEGAAREAPRAEAHRRQPGRQRGGDPGAGLVPVRAQCNHITSFYGSSCANNGEGALNTPEPLPLFSTRI